MFINGRASGQWEEPQPVVSEDLCGYPMDTKGGADSQTCRKGRTLSFPISFIQHIFVEQMNVDPASEESRGPWTLISHPKGRYRGCENV